MKKPELLMPAGNLDVLKTAFIYGADAVYIGGEAFGLRAKAKNFTDEEMREGVRFAHERGKKVYVTVNVFAHNSDIEELKKYLEVLGSIGPDALIISDPGVFTITRKILPDMDIHISTQANNTNYATYEFWYGLGAKRIVTARELSLSEIKEIRENIPEDCEIETFVHGSMCISYSGRCLLSNFLTGRDANRGECTHPCRWKYALTEETRPGQYFPLYETDNGTYIMNSKDLCMIEYIPELVDAGIDSFKVEGRMKTALYAATVARAYREAIDDYFEDPKLYRQDLPLYKDELCKGNFREYTTGFFFGKPDENAQIYDSNTYIKNYVYIGTVEEIDENGLAVFTQKNKFSEGDTVEIMKPDGENIEAKVDGIYDETGCRVGSAPHSKERISADLGKAAAPFDVIRMRVGEE